MRRTYPLIIGAGPAGSAAAIALAQGGAKPLILEASRETGDALCGGFLSWRTLQTLEALGIDLAALGGHSLSKVRLYAGTLQSEALLPAGAIGISRRRLDRLLVERALSAGACLERGVSVAALEPDGGLLLKDRSRIEADALFIATGKYELRGLGRSRKPSPTLGLRVKLSPHPALSALIGDAIELHLFDRGYAGLLLQEDGSANLCLAVREERLAQAGGDPAALIRSLGAECPALGERLAFMEQEPLIDAVAAIPYGWIGSKTCAGQFRLGDQAACIPSLAGEGNGLALASGMRAARAFLEGGERAAPDYQRAFAASAWRPVTTARLLWHWAENPRLAPHMVRAVSALPRLAGLAASLTRIGH